MQSCDILVYMLQIDTTITFILPPMKSVGELVPCGAPGLKPGWIVATHLGRTKSGAMLWCRAGTRAGASPAWRSDFGQVQLWPDSLLQLWWEKILERSWKDLESQASFLAEVLEASSLEARTIWQCSQDMLISSPDLAGTSSRLKDIFKCLQWTFSRMGDPRRSLNHWRCNFNGEDYPESGGATCIGPHPGFQRAWPWRHNTWAWQIFV